jgi:anti-anti-sigma regulatory factor
MAKLPQDVRLEAPSSGVAVVSFVGEHDLTTRDVLRRLLAKLIGENDLVVADFSEASFVDTSVMVLVEASGRAARKRGTMFRLQLATAPIVAMVFEASGVLDELDCFSTREEALEAAAPDRRAEGLGGGSSSA